MTPTQQFWKGRPVMYRVFDKAGRLIYIGASHDLAGRFRGHEIASWWYELIGKIRVQVFPTREAAFAAESVAIQEEQPAFNIKQTGRPEGDFSTWTIEDLRACKAWRDADDYRRRIFVPSSLWRTLAAMA